MLLGVDPKLQKLHQRHLDNESLWEAHVFLPNQSEDERHLAAVVKNFCPNTNRSLFPLQQQISFFEAEPLPKQAPPYNLPLHALGVIPSSNGYARNRLFPN